MKTKTNTLMMVVALLAYLVGLCNASAFYDPGAQRWLNRDPAGEKGGINLYVFTHNGSINWIDGYGLEGITSGERFNVMGMVIMKLLLPQTCKANHY
jgi:hypothetical protein